MDDRICRKVICIGAFLSENENHRKDMISVFLLIF